MNPIEHPLNRLLKAASRAPEPAFAPPSPAWVRAAVRRGRAAHGARAEADRANTLLTWSLAVSTLVMALGWAMHYSAAQNTPPEPLSLANSGIQLTMAP